jgi:DNA-binding response OmpR family regulator
MRPLAPVPTATSSPRVLVVEDDRDLAQNLCDFLVLKGYQTDHATDGLTALNLVRGCHYDVAVVDLMLPGLDGITLCQRIREDVRSTLPIVVLTARDELDTKVTAFDIGADDYVVKPTALREIEARVRALIRRASGERGDSGLLQVGDLCFDPGTMKVERAGQALVLPPAPLKILALLLRSSPNVVQHAAIHQELWGTAQGDSHALTVHMHALRAAVDKPFGRQLIHTVRGFGYRIAHEPSSV